MLPEFPSKASPNPCTNISIYICIRVCVNIYKHVTEYPWDRNLRARNSLSERSQINLQIYIISIHICLHVCLKKYTKYVAAHPWHRILQVLNSVPKYRQIHVQIYQYTYTCIYVYTHTKQNMLHGNTICIPRISLQTLPPYSRQKRRGVPKKNPVVPQDNQKSNK